MILVNMVCISRKLLHVFKTDSNTESGLIVFKIIEGTFAHTNCQLEIVMDENVFPSYTSSKARTRQYTFGETGDAMVRELDVSKITVRLTQKTDKKGDENKDHTVARLSGPTLTTLQQALYKPYELSLKSNDGAVDKVTVQLKYLPVKMQLDPSESINNMGTLRVDVLDAAELPAADRNGFSDPFCRFKLNGKEVFKTKVQKKTLHPAWNEFFEVQIKSRTAAEFKCDVYDWDFGDKADFLGSTKLNLELLEPFQPQELAYQLDGKSGTIRLKMLFKPDYVTRSRQGSSTFSGTFGPAGKVIGAPVKGVGLVGGGVVRGASGAASFLKRGFTGRQKDDTSKNQADDGAATTIPPPPIVDGASETPNGTPQGTPSRAAPLTEVTTPSTPPQHTRSRSFGSPMVNGTPKSTSGAETGTAQFTILSATGYPEGSHLRITVNQLGGKKSREIHKTKAVKAPASETVDFGSSETFKASCAADTQFQIQVKDHHGMFGGEDLGEAFFFVDDQGTGGAEKTITAGNGTIVLKSTFSPAAGTLGTATPDLRPSTPMGEKGADGEAPGKKRRSFLSKREPRTSVGAS